MEALGFICYLVGFAFAVGVLSVDILFPAPPKFVQSAAIACGAVIIAVGVGLRRFATWSRWLALLLAFLGFCVLPVTFPLAAFVGYVLLSKKGRFVFTKAYQDAVTDVPDVPGETSKLLMAVLGVIIIASVAVILFYKSVD